MLLIVVMMPPAVSDNVLPVNVPPVIVGALMEMLAEMVPAVILLALRSLDFSVSDCEVLYLRVAHRQISDERVRDRSRLNSSRSHRQAGNGRCGHRRVSQVRGLHGERREDWIRHGKTLEIDRRHRRSPEQRICNPARSHPE